MEEEKICGKTGIIILDTEFSNELCVMNYSPQTSGGKKLGWKIFVITEGKFSIIFLFCRFEMFPANSNIQFFIWQSPGMYFMSHIY